jgi:PAS domain S-box-containing protein
MDERQAFDLACALLEQSGKLEALAELRRARTTLEAYQLHGKTLTDVTRSLLESEKTYRLVFSHELDPVSLSDPRTGRFIEVNDSWVRLYGYSREEALKMSATDVSAEPAKTADAMKAATTHDQAKRIEVRWHRAKDGTVFPVELTCGRLLLEGREVIYAAMRDITERSNVEKTLARSAESFRALIESMTDGVIVGRKGAVVYMSPSMLRMLGYSDENDVVGARILDFVHADDRQQASARIYSLVSSDKTSVPPIQERLLRQDGSVLVTELTAMKTVFDGEPAVLAIVRDVGERKELEAQLMLNDRLASIGRLAASVGHELNNPLAYVLGNVGFLERELSGAGNSGDLSAAAAARFSSYVEIIGEGARRMRDIVHDLKTLARADGPESAHVELSSLLDVCANMAGHELRSGTKLVKEYRDRVAVIGSETRLGQVFLNILVNAMQAIPEDDARDHEVRIVLRAAGSDAIVEISDTGAGVPPLLVDRIFEPFFTTKGSGSGIGLSISHRIVRSAGGTIACAARPGGGTMFRVTLPAIESP